ncbi:MAG: alginate lyase family protein [Anaerolineales bacterium]
MTVKYLRMSLLNRILLLPKAAAQLGMGPIWLYAKYQLKLRSGWLRWKTPPGGDGKISRRAHLRIVVTPADKEGIKKVLGGRAKELFTEADEVLGGQVRLFDAAPRKLELRLPGQLKHWTSYANNMPEDGGIKPVWEAGRFGWATVLARAYWLSGEDRYAEGFWKYFEEFVAANPPNLGPHWSSAQEVALRIISWAFCYSLLANAASTTAARKAALVAAVVQHAQRIPPTLDYARAQNNNHLLSEALGLYTAATLLPEHSEADRWKQKGMAIFVEGIERQVHDDGAYAQHSSNYHRLMLQLGVWAVAVAKSQGETLPGPCSDKLRKATAWLGILLDKESGKVPNLGPNDGAYILPLTVLPFADYRPALQAANSAVGAPVLQAGPWDEMALWLGVQPSRRQVVSRTANSPLRLEGMDSWAYLRAAEFRERPGHADQLHLDLWWRGLNIAQDAGSYLYAAPAPWDNALAATKVHNTLAITSGEQMTRADRFLWLDWAQARVLATRNGKDGRLGFVSAEHVGYEHLGLTHRRDVDSEANRWVVSDHVLPTRKKSRVVNARLHWLLPDWGWQLESGELRLKSPHGRLELSVENNVGERANFYLFRAGELIHGTAQADPVLGWVSPTYGVKAPALSFNIDVSGSPPFTITTTWTLPA